MGGYQDYSMQLPGDGQDVAGVCHARGVNADIPPQWMMYFKVADIEASLTAVREQGGEMVTAIKSFGGESKYAVIKDPAGAVCAIYQDGQKPCIIGLYPGQWVNLSCNGGLN
eukprot:TRINITY_DN4721_c0_g2_i1.p1 TRINITY_DN4721_c0_g2~~TRINITY_DN4721_c0_g2_i1.p1  ORF type:complete len:130 (+),score=10.63 TRINITY_DN4721_c0_g2_i1:55-390(+)